MKYSEEEITRFFDALTPEDFERPRTSANRIERLPDGDRSEADFELFVSVMVEATRVGYEVASGQPTPYGVLQSGSERRCFVPRAGETPADFLERLRREAASFGADWLFVSVLSRAHLGKAIDMQSDQGRAEAEKAGLATVVNWYAEAKPFNVVRFGAITLDGTTTLMVYEGDNLMSTSPYFRKILGSSDA